MSKSGGKCCDKPLVSIIVPVYNVAPYLRECVESIMRQTYTNLEIILVEGGSADGSGLICVELAELDKRVTVVKQYDKGLPNARNQGMDAAKGEFVWFVDSDDKIHPEAVEKCVGLALAHSLDVVLFDTDFFGDGQKCEIYEGAYHRSQHYETANGKELIAKLLDNGDFYMSAWMYVLNRQFLVQNDISFVPDILHEDNAFTFLVLFRAARVGHIYENLYIQRFRSDSLTAMPIDIRDVEGVLACMEDISRRHGWLSDKKEKAITRRFLLWLLGNVIRYLRKINAGVAEYERVKAFCADIANIDCHDIAASRVIWYGFGHRCRRLLHELQPYQPTEIWDMQGVAPARKPAFDTLGAGDAVVVCVDDYSVFEEIEEKCQQAGCAKVLHWQEYCLQQHIKTMRFPLTL
jgi:glycosyltransferase involved in cell wall biosynthesis